MWPVEMPHLNCISMYSMLVTCKSFKISKFEMQFGKCELTIIGSITMMGKTNKRKKGSALLPTSKVSKTVQIAKDLNTGHADGIKLSEGLKAAVEELASGSTRSQKVVLKEMNELLQAQLIALSGCQESANGINPVPHLGQALKSIQREQNRIEAAESGSQRAVRVSASVRTARDILGGGNKENEPRKKAYRSVKGKDIDGWMPPFAFPTPRNGSQYSPPEVVALLVDRRLTPKKHAGNAKRFLIKNDLVPVKTENALARVVRISNGDPSKAPSWWDNTGRPPISLPSKFIGEFEKTMEESGTSTVGSLEIKNLLVHLKESSLQEQGILPVNVKVSRPCQKKYEALVKQSENAVITPASRDTTESREIAAKSLIAAVLFAACVLVMTYRQCELEEAEKWKFPNRATEGAREGYEIMKQVHGDKPFLCIMPFQQINMDDSTQVISNGKRERDKPSSRMIHRNYYKDNKFRAPSKAPKTAPIGGTAPQVQAQNDPVNPQRVKVSHISNAFGSYAEPTINFLGLSDDELPPSKCPTGFASVEVHGLLEGKIVFLNFIRKTAVRGEEARYVALRNGPLHRFVDDIRKQHYGIGQGGALTERHTCVVSSDGDMGQVSCNKDEGVIEKEREKKIASWKHNPARTNTEQSQDLQHVFPTLNRLEASSTIDENLPEEMIPLLSLVKLVFEDCKRKFGLDFPDKKKKTNMHYVARFPENFAIATQKKYVIPGYLANGQTDHVSRMVPDLRVMIEDTLDRPILMEEWGLVQERMPEICERLLEFGWISDETFIDWGFPADENLSGEKVYRPDSVAQEHLQRAKLMDHHFQRMKRNQLAIDNAAKINQKLLKDCNTVNTLLKTNVNAEQALSKLMNPEGDSENCNLADATLEQFAKLLKDQLKSFVLVRKFESLGRSHGIPGNKGDLEKSRLPGSDTLIRAAFDYRESPIQLKVLSLVVAAATGAAARGPRAIPMVTEVFARGETSHLRFIVSIEFAALVKKAFDPFDVTTLDVGSVDLVIVQQRSDLLHDILQERLTNHIQQRCNKSLRTHWYWSFTRANIGVEAAIMVLMEIVKEDLEPAKWDPNACLLQSILKNKFVIVENRIKEMEGCYGVFDRERGRMIRTGKACNTGRTFAARCWGRGGHQECASTPNLSRIDSKFYRSYPSEAANQFVDGTRRGYFEQLQVYCLQGFHRQNSESIKPIVEMQDRKKSIFFWSDDTIAHLERANISGANTIEEKQLVAASYLAETCCELTLSPEDNVSQSQGAEALMGKSCRI